MPARPTDGPYAFPLLPVGEGGFLPRTSHPGVDLHVRQVAGHVMGEAVAARFLRRVERWEGPADVQPDGTTPFVARQESFREVTGDLQRFHLQDVMRGVVHVVRPSAGRVDYVMRDHHVLDAILHHRGCTGALPSGVLHVDRHSDWCADGFLEARVPQQAATWWALLHGLKRPGGAPVLDEKDVVFATAQALVPGMSGRNVGASVRVPGCVDPGAMTWRDALEHLGTRPRLDWVSVDLDYLQPSAQLHHVSDLLRDARFAAVLARAAVCLFVLSPQFANGGDVHPEWTSRGTTASAWRLLKLLRRGRVAQASVQ